MKAKLPTVVLVLFFVVLGGLSAWLWASIPPPLTADNVAVDYDTGRIFDVTNPSETERIFYR